MNAGPRHPIGPRLVPPGAAGILLLVLAAACEPPDLPEPEPGTWGAPPQVERELLATVQGLFDAMEARDPEAAEALLLPGGRFLSIRETEDGFVPSEVSHEDFLGMLAEADYEILERFWDPEILVRGDLAVVWTPYDLFLGREFSHCGVDAFTLVRDDGAWRIATVVYTVEVTGCDEPPMASPLGPPEWSR